MKDFTLLIINCQNDFTLPEGTTYIPKSKKMIPNICKFMIEHKNEINRIIFSCDNHPNDHCSFKTNGGGWPSHCVSESFGQNINSELIKTARDLNINYYILNKGEVSDLDEYSSVMYSDFIDGLLVLKTATDACKVLTDDIVICGCSGDFEIKDTINDLVKKIQEENIYVYLDGIVSIDDNTQLMNLLEDKTNIKII